MSKRQEVPNRQDIRRVADELTVPEAAVRAVLEVETGNRSGFLKDGRARILYEAHIFSRLTDGKFNYSNPLLSTGRWKRGLYLGGSREWTRLGKACRLDERAALQSCSWGLFQVMGMHWQALGYQSPRDFVDSQKSISGQMDTFMAFIKHNRLDGYLRAGQWGKFARRYNGPGYRKNRYDEKLADAFDRFSALEGIAYNVTSKKEPNGEMTIRVRRGDTLYHLARRHTRGDLSKLLALNPGIIDPDDIDVGQELKVA